MPLTALPFGTARGNGLEQRIFPLGKVGFIFHDPDAHFYHFQFVALVFLAVD